MAEPASNLTETSHLLGVNNVRRFTMNFGRITIVKLVELILAIAIVWIHYDTYEAADKAQLFVITATYAGFALIVISAFLGHLIGHPINRTMDMFLCVVGAVLYISSGSMTINHWRGFRFSSSKENWAVTMGSMAIVQGALFILDAFFVFKAE